MALSWNEKRNMWFRIDNGHYVSHTTPSYTLKRAGKSTSNPWTVLLRGVEIAKNMKSYAAAKEFVAAHREGKAP
jgi:hypothetical protein